MHKAVANLIDIKQESLQPILKNPELVHGEHLDKLENTIISIANNWHEGATQELLPAIMAYYEGCYLTRITSTKSLELVNKFVAKLLKIYSVSPNSPSAKLLKTYHSFGSVYLYLLQGNYSAAFALSTRLIYYAESLPESQGRVIFALTAEVCHRNNRSDAALSIWDRISQLDIYLRYFSVWGLPYLSALANQENERQIMSLCDGVINFNADNQFALALCKWFKIRSAIIGPDANRFTIAKTDRSVSIHPYAQLEIWAKYLQKPNRQTKKLLLQPESIRKYWANEGLSWQFFRPSIRLLAVIVDYVESSDDDDQLAENVARALNNIHLLPTRELATQFTAILYNKLG